MTSIIVLPSVCNTNFNIAAIWPTTEHGVFYNVIMTERQPAVCAFTSQNSELWKTECFLTHEK